MTRNLQLIRTDYVTRTHIYIDSYARNFNAFDVELLGETVRMQNDTMERLWHQVQSVIDGLRARYDAKPLFPLTHLVPFARVIAFDGARESARLSVATNQRVGDTHPEHEVRVDALVDALELLAFIDGRPSPIRTMN